MFCEKCGNKISDTDVFCERCGAVVSGNGANTQSADARNANIQSGNTWNADIQSGNTQSADTKRRSRFKITAVIAILALIIAGVAVITVGGAPQKIKINRMMKTAQRYLEEMQYEQAVLAYDAVIEIEPKHLPAYMGKANTYVAMEDIENAVSTMSKAAKVARDEYDATGKKLDKADKMYELYAQILAGDGQFERAIRVLNEAKEWLQDDDLSKMLEELVGKTVEMNVPDAKITFTDSVLEKDIRTIINKPSGDIMISDVWYVEEVKIWGDFVGAEANVKSYSRDYFTSTDKTKHTTTQTIRTLDDLAYFRNLKKLTVNYHVGVDISVLNNKDNFPNLRMISLIGNGLSDISAISGLTFLTDVSLAYNDITDFTPISALTRLSSLSISDNEGMHSTEKLTNLIYLKSLSLFGVDDVDVEAVATLPNLKTLHLSSGDYSKLAACKKLNYLEIEVDESNIQYLAALTQECKSLRVHVKSKVKDISVISSLNWLESLDLVTQNTSNVYDLSVIQNFTNLKKLELGFSSYDNYAILGKLPSLETVEIRSGNTGVIEEVKKVLPEEKIVISD